MIDQVAMSGGAFLALVVLLMVGSLGWGLYLGERRRCADLRAMLTYGAPVERPETGIFPPAPEPEDRAASALPQIKPEEIERGADDLVALADANGIELNREEARRQALEMLTTAHGFNAG